MTSTSPSEPAIEPPECPVCLESYNENITIPRVLSCGHSACETCLTHLHLLSSTTLRCPCCTHLVNFPHSQGPTALPKNIDLLRFCPTSNNNTSNTKTIANTDTSQRRRFTPRVWSDELYASWKDWILPHATLFVDDEDGSIRICLNVMGLRLSAIMRCRLVEDRAVGLVPVGCYDLNDQLLEYSYVGKVMSVVSLLNDEQRNEISLILGVCLRNSRVCNVLGLWLDSENDGILYLVVEKMSNGVLLNLGVLEYGVDQGNNNGSLLDSVGVELCEALIGLHSKGVVCGCLGLSCLCFDEFGHVCVDIGEVLVIGRKVRECVVEVIKGGRDIDGSEVERLVSKMLAYVGFVSPEVWMELLRNNNFELQKNDVGYEVCFGSDVWILACVLMNILIGKKFLAEMYNYMRIVLLEKNKEVNGYKIMYLQWVETINTMLEPFFKSDYASVYEVLLKCLAFDPKSRPHLYDVFNSVKELRSSHSINNVSSLKIESMKENISLCLFLGELCNLSNDVRNESREHSDCTPDLRLAGQVTVDNVVEGLSGGKIQCKVLQGHMDCVTALCVGGGYLFSASYDKTIKVWSLQDFMHVHTFRGHEHKIMDLVFVNQENLLCISADSGGGIYVWEINETLAEEPLEKWNEEKNWRYSGIHALAVSESGCLYTGSGDRLIKAWLLRDHTLLCNMEGHKSVVSALALCNGVLYSGSWDGTVRLWCLHDHSPLAVFGEDAPGAVSSVHSLFADQNMIIAAHENGCIKIWMNDSLKISIKIHNGAIFALAMDGKWLFLGGWDRTVKIQEITGAGSEMDIIEVGSIACESVITAMLCAQGVLFVGCANKLVKVYHCGV